MADSDRRQTAGQATDVSRRRLASVGAVGGGGCRIHPPGVVGTGSALSFAGVAAARLAAMNGRENHNNILFSVGACAFICQSVNY